MEIIEYHSTYKEQTIALWLRCGLVKPWNNPRLDIERKMRVNPELFLLGIKEGKVLASVMGGYEGHRGWINYLAVDPDYQRQGLATQIMTEVEARLQAKGAPKINLQVRTGNKSIIAFYQSLGYNVDEVISMGKRLIQDDEYTSGSL